MPGTEMAETKKTPRARILPLECACCGGPAPALQQWWNRDTDHGLCARCGDEITAKDGAEYVAECYGKRGIHWDPPRIAQEETIS